MTRYGNEKEKMRSLLDPGPVPEIVEMRLREAYAALPERRPARPARPRLRVLRTALAAAALCVALPVTVLAATGELLPMIEGAIAFFRTDAATTLDSIQNTFEAYNAAVALEKTDAGVTFTVDNISVDDNFINLFGRMQATGLRAKLQEANTAGDGNALFDGQMPDRWAFAYNDMPRPVVRVGDAVYGLDNSLNDSLNFYFQDDDTVCYARRILVNDTLPDSFAMQIAYEKSKQCKKRRLYRVIREGNYTNFPGFYGMLMRNCYTFPLSSNRDTMKKFLSSMDTVLQHGDFMLVYPEQSMWWNYRKPKPLKKGAYTFAAKNHVPVLPCFITMEDSDILGDDGFYVQEYTIHIAEPIYPDPQKTQAENVDAMRRKNAAVWKQIYEEFYGIPLVYDTAEAVQYVGKPTNIA